MKWLNNKGLLVCVIVFILLNSFFANVDNSGGGDGGAYNIIESIENMVESMAIGSRNSRYSNDTLIYIKGNYVIAFLISLLIYLTVFLKKKK